MLLGKRKNIDLNDVIKELVEKQRPNVKKVIKGLDSIIKHEPDNAKARTWKAVAVIVQARLERYKNPMSRKWLKILNDGISQLKKIMKQDPDVFRDEKLAVETVIQLYNVAALDVAFEVVNIAIKYNPLSELLWIGKINVLQGMNKIDELIEACMQAMGLFKDKAIFKQYHAVALAIASRYDEALSAINKYLEEEPGSIELAKGKAGILMSMKKYEEAVKFIDEFISRIPKMSSKLDLIKIKGKALYHMGRYDDALKVFEEILKQNKNDAEILYYIGAVLNKQYRFKEAYRYLKKATELDPENADAWFKLADTLEMREHGDKQQFLMDYMEARDAIERALFFDPDNLVYKLKKANIIEVLGKVIDERLLDEALKLLRDILEHADSSMIKAAALSNIANILGYKGRYEEAIKYYKEAIKANPNFIITYFDFAYLYELLGRYDDALKCLREAHKRAHNDYWRRKAEKYIKRLQKHL